MRVRARAWSPASRRLVVLFLLVLVPPAVALAGLGLLVLEQDRRLLAERTRERTEATATALARALVAAVDRARSTLVGGGRVEGATMLRLQGDVLSASPTGSLPWTPSPVRLTEADSAPFAEAEIAEFQRRGDRGRATYEALTRSPSPAVRAGALLRLARLHRGDGRLDAALATYAQLATITDVAFDGMPADLLARRAGCDLLHRAARRRELEACASALAVDLREGRWSLDRVSWRHSAEQVSRWTSSPLDASADQYAVAAAAEWLWQQRDRLPRGWHLVDTPQGVASIALSTAGPAVIALVLPPGQPAHWVREAVQTLPPRHLSVAIVAADGRRLSSEEVAAPRPDDTVVTMAGARIGLPWDVRVAMPAEVDDTSVADRRRTMAAGLLAVLLLVAGGAFLIWRVVQHELAVAALQTEFVATVSHEFRTPLASLRHVAELLDEDDELPGDRRRALYGVIDRNATRLSSLVDTLLDFSRIESGRRLYTLRRLDASTLARQVVDEFLRQVSDDQLHVSWQIDDVDLSIEADADALGRALANLLENAVKYGPRPCRVELSVRRDGDRVQLAVSDNGPGIPPAEQPTVFEKFFRGEDATRRGIRGTGLGLAIVAHVTRAHGGTVSVESNAGGGSTFRITLPAAMSGDRATADQRVEPVGVDATGKV